MEEAQITGMHEQAKECVDAQLGSCRYLCDHDGDKVSPCRENSCWVVHSQAACRTSGQLHAAVVAVHVAG